MKLSKKDMKQILGGEQVPPGQGSILTCFYEGGSVCMQYVQDFRCGDRRIDYKSKCYYVCFTPLYNCVDRPI